MSNSLTITDHTELPDVVVDAPTPGMILREEFLDPLDVSQYRLAKAIHVSESFVSKIAHGDRAISADLSVRLGRFFGVSPGFFLNLQTIHDLRIAQASPAIRGISPWDSVA